MAQVPQPPPAARFVAGVFGFVFGGVGLTVLIFLWSMPFDRWDSPPLFFRIFGSFIAIAFVAMGGTVAFSAITGGGLMSEQSRLAGLVQRRLDDQNGPQRADPVAPGSYVCPNCGATLTKADVSPMGDVKCTFCGTWFNVHRK